MYKSRCIKKKNPHKILFYVKIIIIQNYKFFKPHFKINSYSDLKKKRSKAFYFYPAKPKLARTKVKLEEKTTYQSEHPKRKSSASNSCHKSPAILSSIKSC